MTYKLSDNTIAQVAKLLQVALLTGTDIVDNLRTLRLTLNGDTLEPDAEYLANFENNLNKMVENLAEVATQTDEDVN
jgi:hypothetical protein